MLQQYLMPFRTLFIIVFLFFPVLSFAQSTISGQVIDSDTKLPLQGASVFAQNTTKGVITDKEGNYRLSLNKGGYELIVSFTGYINQRINVEANEDKQLNIILKPEDKSMEAVVITSSNEVENGWEQHGAFFLDHFLGATPFSDSCFLLNPEVLKFFYFKRSDRLKIIATEPLLITNKALGYHLRYQLDSFVYYNQTNINSYRGNCLYTAMEGDSMQIRQWKENRRQVYNGSRIHFLRAYYNRTLKQEGFTVDMLSSTDANKFNRLANYYDTIYYYFDNETANAELSFAKKASISYTKQPPEKDYLEQFKLPADVKLQISYVDLLEPIIIKPNGFFLDQKSWINQGYWSWKNLADQLPYDYEPE